MRGTMTRPAKINRAAVPRMSDPTGLGGTTPLPDLDDLGDVTATTPVDGDVLVWDDALSQWVNEQPDLGPAIHGTWRFDNSTTAADPGSGDLRYDSATPASVANIYISQTNKAGSDCTRVFEYLTTGSPILLQQRDDSARYLKVTLSGSPTDNGAWWTLPVTIVGSGTLPANNADMTVVLFIGGGGSGGSPLTIEDEGTPLATNATSLDFVGAGVTASGTGAAKTITIPGVADILDLPTAETDDALLLQPDGAGGVEWREQFASVSIEIDGLGIAITAGVKGYRRIPFACTIVEATILADQSGSIVVDIWKDTLANYPPVDADSITASAPPTVSSATNSSDTTLTGWTTAIAAGDVLGFNVDSCTTITRITLSLKLRRE